MPGDHPRSQLRIGELAAECGLNPKTVRYYEAIGLLTPAGRTDAGYRFYTPRHAQRLAFIRRAQSLGLSLAAIADILAVRDAGGAPCRRVRALAEAKVVEIDRQLDGLQALRRELTSLAARASEVEPACAAGAQICLAIESPP
jgi:DNA-binding transcriptional MerR regulator